MTGTYCVKCRKKTGCVDPRQSCTNGRFMTHSKCEVCSTKKCSFGKGKGKTQKGKGVVEDVVKYSRKKAGDAVQWLGRNGAKLASRVIFGKNKPLIADWLQKGADFESENAGRRVRGEPTVAWNAQQGGAVNNGMHNDFHESMWETIKKRQERDLPKIRWGQYIK